ncbi:MAG: hypothetical protein IJV04_01635 [Lachnospiraceae bacterium]|nr:hypothetical protein [Lachnospiraceae bacterium]
MVKNKGHTEDIIWAYEGLANAVVIQACKDYRRALRRIRRNRKAEEALTEKEAIERFFRSNWFGVLTGIDPEMLIRKLQEDVVK